MSTTDPTPSAQDVTTRALADLDAIDLEQRVQCGALDATDLAWLADNPGAVGTWALLSGLAGSRLSRSDQAADDVADLEARLVRHVVAQGPLVGRVLPDDSALDDEPLYPPVRHVIDLLDDHGLLDPVLAELAPTSSLWEHVADLPQVPLQRLPWFAAATWRPVELAFWLLDNPDAALVLAATDHPRDVLLADLLG